MLVKAKRIIGNKVVTQSGYNLGRVFDFEVETTDQNIVKYYVHGGMLDFLKEPLIINANQVVEIQKEKIIVADAIVSEKAAKKKTSPGIEYVP